MSSFEGFILIRGVQRKPSSAFAVFQVPTAQNNQYTKVAPFGRAHPELLQSHLVVPFSAALQLLQKSREGLSAQSPVGATWMCRGRGEVVLGFRCCLNTGVGPRYGSWNARMESHLLQLFSNQTAKGTDTGRLSRGCTGRKSGKRISFQLFQFPHGLSGSVLGVSLDGLSQFPFYNPLPPTLQMKSTF